MNDYSPLEIWHNPELIETAIHLARDAARFSEIKESYFTEDLNEFYPHVWVVEAICTALKEQRYD